MGAWLRRWTGLRAFSVQDAYAASLVEESPAYIPYTDGSVPANGQVLAHGPGEATGILEEEQELPLAGALLTSPG